MNISQKVKSRCSWSDGYSAYNIIAQAGYKAYEGKRPSLANGKVHAYRGSTRIAAYYQGAMADGKGGFEKHVIAANFNSRGSTLNTPGNILSNFLHEYKGHGILGLKDDGPRGPEHSKVYLMQREHPSFRFTTGDYRKKLETFRR